MHLSAVSVATSNMQKSIEFYSLLGFTFPFYNGKDPHIEAEQKTDEIRLMIDTKELLEQMIGEEPVPSNHSSFAIEFPTKEAVRATCKDLERHNFVIFKQPWEASWGQFYAIVEDPDGYRVDVYTNVQ